MCSSRPFQTRLDEELVVRLSGKGKKLVRQRAPRRQRMNLLEDQNDEGLVGKAITRGDHYV